MDKVLIAGINQVATDKGLDREVIFDAIEVALVSAYKRNYGSVANVSAHVDRQSGEMRIFAEREVVDDVLNPRTEVSQEDARRVTPNAALGDVIRVETKPDDFGRIAAQTAKQVILQRIREAERDTVYENFAQKANYILTVQVRSVDATSGTVTLSVDDKHEVLMMREDQIPNERLRRGDYLKVLVVDVHKSPKGPMIRLSRTNRNLLRRLMEQEIPEVRDGLVEIKNIAREPGARSKAAVAATVPGIDPVGSCVGQRGLRIQNIVNELSGEKIDVVEWSESPAAYITNALSPAKVSNVLLDEKSSIKTAIVIVPDKQLSLAIGKEGQNARLAAKLTGWRIDIKSESEAAAEGLDRIIAERAMQSFSKADDLLAMAERLLKGGGQAGPDRLWAAAQALKDETPAVTEAATDGEQDKRTRKKAKVARPEPTKEKEEELVEGLPMELGDYARFDAALAAPRGKETAQFDDAFQRSLEAVQLTPEAALPSEAPFDEKETPAPAPPPSTAKTGDALPEIITADMLRARMAQRKEMDMRAVEIEIPEELLAGYKEEGEGDAAGSADQRGKSKTKAKKGADKKGKKRWHPNEGDSYEDYF